MHDIPGIFSYFKPPAELQRQPARMTTDQKLEKYKQQYRCMHTRKDKALCNRESNSQPQVVQKTQECASPAPGSYDVREAFESMTRKMSPTIHTRFESQSPWQSQVGPSSYTISDRITRFGLRGQVTPKRPR